MGSEGSCYVCTCTCTIFLLVLINIGICLNSPVLLKLYYALPLIYSLGYILTNACLTLKSTFFSPQAFCLYWIETAEERDRKSHE